MAVSARMMAVLQRVDAAREAHFAGLRAKNVVDQARKEKAKKVEAARRRAVRAAEKKRAKRK